MKAKFDISSEVNIKSEQSDDSIQELSNAIFVKTEPIFDPLEVTADPLDYLESDNVAENNQDVSSDFTPPSDHSQNQEEEPLISLTKSMKKDKAELCFKRLFKDVIINGSKRKYDQEKYKSLFSRTTELPTLEGGLKAVSDEVNALLFDCMRTAGLDPTDHEHHFPANWFAGFIVQIIESEKPGFFTLLKPRQKGLTESVHYDVLNDNITSKRMKELGRLLKERFLNFVDDQSCDSDLSKVGIRKRRANRDPVCKATPGKKMRRGKNPKHCYCYVNFVPGKSPIIRDISLNKNKERVENLMRKGSSALWKENCPELFEGGLDTFEEYCNWLYTPSVEGEGTEVVPLHLTTHQLQLNTKLEDLVTVVKEYCEVNNTPYVNRVGDGVGVDPLLEDCLQHNILGVTADLEAIKAIRMLGKVTSAGRTAQTVAHTITVDPERKIPGCAIHIKVLDGKLCYHVSVEGTEMFPTNNIRDAIKAYFLVTIAANIDYHNGGVCFGLIMEHFFYNRPQTVKIANVDLTIYRRLQNFWNSKKLSTSLPVLSLEPHEKNR